MGENRNMMKHIHNEMLSDIEDNGMGSTKESMLAKESFETRMFDGQAESNPATPQSEKTNTGLQPIENIDSDEMNLVVIADFDPPASHQAHMLKLCVGELVSVLGQDGRGWWYGRKQNNKEGWFPPSYVQLKAAHFSSDA